MHLRPAEHRPRRHGVRLGAAARRLRLLRPARDRRVGRVRDRDRAARRSPGSGSSSAYAAKTVRAPSPLRDRACAATRPLESANTSLCASSGPSARRAAPAPSASPGRGSRNGLQEERARARAVRRSSRSIYRRDAVPRMIPGVGIRGPRTPRPPYSNRRSFARVTARPTVTVFGSAAGHRVALRGRAARPRPRAPLRRRSSLGRLDQPARTTGTVSSDIPSTSPKPNASTPCQSPSAWTMPISPSVVAPRDDRPLVPAVARLRRHQDPADARRAPAGSRAGTSPARAAAAALRPAAEHLQQRDARAPRPRRCPSTAQKRAVVCCRPASRPRAAGPARPAASAVVRPRVAS